MKNQKTFTINSSTYSAECGVQHGECELPRDNFIVLKRDSSIRKRTDVRYASMDENAVKMIESACGKVVLLDDENGGTFVFLTACDRIQDATLQVFGDYLDLDKMEKLPHGSTEMTLGFFGKVHIPVPIDECVGIVDKFYAEQ